MRKLAPFALVLVLLVSALTAAPASAVQLLPVAQKYADEAAQLISVLFLPLALPLDNGLGDALPQGEMFINGLLVLDSSVGLVQTTSSQNFRTGIGYDRRSYMRITLSPPASARFIRGMAVATDGSLHVYDASAGLPANIRWLDGLPVTTAGQLCVVFG